MKETANLVAVVWQMYLSEKPDNVPISNYDYLEFWLENIFLVEVQKKSSSLVYAEYSQMCELLLQRFERCRSVKRFNNEEFLRWKGQYI